MHLRRRAFLKYFVVSLAVAAFYCEWFVYIMQPLFWPELKCGQDETCTKILFVADPQIQGELWAPSPLNHLFIYDSDQYLKLTYSVVTDYFKPDVLVYLGDIMDEGSIATVPQYQRYVKRIKNIFDSTYESEMEIWLPGDNDIGGEMEPIRKDKIVAFEREFQKIPELQVVTSRNISYYKVNGITNSISKQVDNSTGVYKMVVSHYPVTLKYNLRNQVVNEIHPDIIFCAHSHESKYVINSKDFNSRTVHTFLKAREILQVFPDEGSLYEIYVPTCSYRMGTNDIGYGAAIYEHKSRIITYAVFWSPQRFLYLFFYLAILIFVIIYCLVFYATKLCKQRNGVSISASSSRDSISLLKNMMTTSSFTDASKNY